LPQIYLIRAAAAALLAIICATLATGVSATGRGRWLAPLGGGLLVLVALFGLLPELGQAMGWLAALGFAAAGYGLLALLDRWDVPVCPSCSHGESYLAALIAAVAAHALVDGWSMVAVSIAAPGPVSVAISTAVILHKVPEGLALGALVRPSTRTRNAAIAFCVLAELPTVIGGAIGLWAVPAGWVNYPLALAAGTFMFLGTHAVFAPRRR
jgi:hypothetical protein